MLVAERAASDLAARLGVEPATVRISRAEKTVWPNTALGCPRSGLSYAQVRVEGYRVFLGHAGRVFIYHAGPDGLPFLCPSADADGGRDFVPPPGFRT